MWKVLEEMAADLRKKHVVIPSAVIDDLKSAKTMIEILKADPCRGETVQKVEEYLANVEFQLVSEGQRIGTAYVKKWLRKLDGANKKISEEVEEETRFISGLTSRRGWIRVKSLPELSIEKLKVLADASNLQYTVQKDGCLVVYGESKQIKDFVKSISAKHGLKTAKEVREN